MVYRGTTMMRALVLVLALGACTSQPVKIPIATRAAPPAELLAPIDTTAPVFVAPTAADASAALTPAGERRLKELVLDLFERVNAWQAWATDGARK